MKQCHPLTMLAITCITMACGNPMTDTQSWQSPASLYGGTETEDFETTGALVNGFSLRSFCTATLIAPDWVLTAAHCVNDKSPADIFFTMSPRVTPPSKPFHKVTRIRVHPEYRAVTFLNDLALLQLENPIEADNLPLLNTTVLTESYANEEPLFVGYGYNEDQVSGVRRTATIPISDVGIATFTSRYSAESETGACFGDSGGPTFSEISGELRLTGIVSNISDATSDDPCIGSYTVTRVDRYISWILATIPLQMELPSCSADASQCFCAEACNSDGSCDNSQCQTMTCTQTYDCASTCEKGDSACQNDCYIQASPAGILAFESFFECGIASCESAKSNELFDCLLTHCNDSFHLCFDATDCQLTGGDCNMGETCQPGRYTLTSCQPGNDGEPGNRCDPNADIPPCADGLACTLYNSEYVCRQLCFSDDDCSDAPCGEPMFEFRGASLSVCETPVPQAISGACTFSPIASSASSVLALFF